MSDRRPFVKIITESLSQHLICCSTPLSGTRVGKRQEIFASPVCYSGYKNRITLLLFFQGCRKKAIEGPTALTPKIDCDQTAIDLSPITFAVPIPHSY
jgi:hypothetical protein